MALCKGCGKEIVWGITAEGTKVPLDASAPTYLLSGMQDPVTGSELITKSVALVSHFKTCSQANQFSKKKQ